MKNRTFRKSDIEEIAQIRHSICQECIWNSEKQRGKEYDSLPEVIKREKDEEYIQYVMDKKSESCLYCSCNIAFNTSLKLRCLSCECPIKKWESLTTKEEEHEILKHLNE